MRYSAVLVEHFLNPRNAGLMREPDGSGSDEYAGCGDLTRFYLRMREGLVAEARFQAYGCGPTIAAASVATELALGRAAEDLAAMKAQDVEDVLEGLPEDRRHAADVAAGAMRAAALDVLRRHQASGPEKRGT
jgi:nitrogen fixation protein NifU and related proteins